MENLYSLNLNNRLKNMKFSDSFGIFVIQFTPPKKKQVKT